MIRLRAQLGFTLIELLVVIAIIGILSSVVLASLTDARASAKQTALRQGVDSMAKVLELNALQTSGSTYSTTNVSRWITSTAVSGTSSCEGVPLPGLTPENTAKIREICIFMRQNTERRGTQFLLIQWYRNHSTFGNYYSFVTRFSNADWSEVYCAGSSGGRYAGDRDPDGDPLTLNDFTGSGCHLNP